MPNRIIVTAALASLFLACFDRLPYAQAQMAVDSFDGPVTQHEIDSFKSYIQTLTPASDNIGNQWAQGHSGEQTKAMGLMYEITGDVAILDRMIGFCDAVLSERNDLAPAPVGQHTVWTGGIDPIWPNNNIDPVSTGGEQGDPIGHLGNCARLILQTPAIWNTPVAIGDPNGFGSTYLARAQTYVTQADYSLDNHVLSSLLDLSRQNHYWWSLNSPYQTGKPVPWNQQMMFNYALENLAICHQILQDDPNRMSTYDGIVQANTDWFFNSGSISYQDNAGNTAYNWAYAPPATGGEDNNHGSLDVVGFHLAYRLGRYGISAAIMTPFANTFVDVMSVAPQHYAGRVDGTDGTGHAAPTTYIRSGYLLLAEFRPDAYYAMMAADLTPGRTTGSIDQFSRFLWVKNTRYQTSQ